VQCVTAVNSGARSESLLLGFNGHTCGTWALLVAHTSPEPREHPTL